MITTAYLVKKAHGEYDGISPTQPDADSDSSKGYSVDFRLLVQDGTLWICQNATVGAAVWAIDNEKDVEIREAIRALTESVSIYLDNYFVDITYRLSATGLEFANDPPTITWASASGDGFLAYLFVGDSLWINGSRRNDGVYDIVGATELQLVVDYDFTQEMIDSNAVNLLGASYPTGLQEACGALGAYDVWGRGEGKTGVIQESIGSYSYTLETSTINGIPYPDDMVSSINPWRRPKVR